MHGQLMRQAPSPCRALHFTCALKSETRGWEAKWRMGGSHAASHRKPQEIGSARQPGQTSLPSKSLSVARPRTPSLAQGRGQEAGRRAGCHPRQKGPANGPLPLGAKGRGRRVLGSGHHCGAGKPPRCSSDATSPSLSLPASQDERRQWINTQRAQRPEDLSSRPNSGLQPRKSPPTTPPPGIHTPRSPPAHLHDK